MVTGPFLLTGGTGTLGRLVEPLLRQAGAPVRILSRRPRERADVVVGDLVTGAGLDAALAGVATVVHCAGTAKGDQEKARRLVRAASGAGVEHLVFISVVGCDQVPIVSGVDRAIFGYYAAKLAAEKVIASSGLAWTTLRATQFYDLVLTIATQLARLPVMPVPAMRYQPIDTGEVAARLAELALGPPAGLVPDLGGPRVYELAELVRGYLSASHRHRRILPVRLPGRAARAARGGALLAPGRAVGHRTWEEFLAERVG